MKKFLLVLMILALVSACSTKGPGDNEPDPDDIVIEKLEDTSDQLFVHGLMPAAIQNDQNKLMWGFADINGEWVIDPIYSEVKPFRSNGYAVATIKADKWGDESIYRVIDTKGEIIYEYKSMYRGSIEMLDNGFFAIFKFYKMEEDHYLEVVDKNSKVIFNTLEHDVLKDMDIDYLFAYSVEEGLYAVHSEKGNDSSCGYLDEYGEIAIDFNFELCGHFENGVAFALSKGYSDSIGQGSIVDKGIGYIDNTGDWLIEETNTWGRLLGRGLDSGKYGSFYNYFSQNGLSVQLESATQKMGAINKQGQVVIPFVYDNMGPFVDGLAIIVVEEKYGLINEEGTEVIPPSKEWIGRINDGFMPYMQNGKIGYLKDNNGTFEVAITPQFEKANYSYSDYHFSDDGYAVVYKGGKWLIIDTTGKIVLESDFDAISFNNWYN